MKQFLVASLALLAASSVVSIAQADPASSSNMSSMARSRMQTVLCPTHVSINLVPVAPAAGWKAGGSPVSLSPDSKNLPRAESGTLICYYAMPDGYNAFVYSQPEAGRTCTVRSDNTGFDCH